MSLEASEYPGDGNHPAGFVCFAWYFVFKEDSVEVKREFTLKNDFALRAGT